MAGLAVLWLWFGRAAAMSDDRLFRGKPESEWIKNVKTGDDQVVKEWRDYGEEGVQVLIRGLEKAKPPGGMYRRLNQRLPYFLKRWLPSPEPDSTRITRECLVWLLSRLGNDAKSAAPIIIWTAGNDEADSVRFGAIGYFNTGGGENCLVNQLPANQKTALLPVLIRAMQDAGNNSLRHNTSILLKYFPEHRDVLAPILVNALQDPEPYVRLYAAEALNRVAPEVAKKAGATSLLITIAKNSDDQRASQAVSALGHSGSQPELAVPALIKCLQSTNTLIGCEAVWALEWAPEDFTAYSDTIIPALGIAAQRKDNVGGYARVAQARWKARSDAKAK